MQAFLLFVLFLAFVWIAIRISRMSTRIKDLEDQLNRLPTYPQQPLRQTAPAAPPQYSPQQQPPPYTPQPVAAPQAAPPVHYEPTYIPPPPLAPTPTGAPHLTASSSDVGTYSAPPPSQPLQPRPHVSLEARLGQNWLNKLGITALVIGLALGLGKLIVKLGPAGKDAIGFFLATAILGLGIFLERKPAYRLFARVLIGGGWALLFFLSYALYNVTALQILHSEAADLTLMFVIAAAMVAHSLRYRSQVVTTFAFLLAFLTVGLSNVTLFSLVAGALLAGALAFIVYRERWYALGLAGLIGVYLNHAVWLSRVLPNGGDPGHPFPQFIPSAALILTYWLIFRLIHVLRPPLETPKHDLNQALATLAALLNSAGLLGLLKFQSSHPEWAFYGLLVLGLAELALSLIARGSLKSDTAAQPNRIAFITLSTLASVMLLTAIPFRLHGSSWVLFWLLESEAFYLSGIRLPEVVFRRIGSLASLFTASLFALAMIGLPLFFGVTGMPRQHTDFAFLQNIPTILAIAAVLYFNAELTPRLWSVAIANAFDRITLLTGTWLASLLIALLCWYKLEPISVAVAWGILGLVLFELAVLLKRSHLRYQAYTLLAAAFLRIFFANMQVTGPHGQPSPSLYTVVPLIAAFIYIYESTHSAFADSRVDSIAGAVFSWCNIVASGTLIYFELRPAWIILGWTALAIALLAVAFVLKRTIFIAQSLVVVLFVVGRGIAYHLFYPAPLATTFYTSLVFIIGVTCGLLLLALPLAFHLRRSLARTENSPLQSVLHHPEQPYFFAPLFLLTLLIYVQLSGGRITIGWVALGVVTFLFALAVNERSYRLSGLGLLLLGVAKILLWDVWHVAPNERYLTLIIMGASLLLVSFLYSRYKETLLKLL